jgi:hypothetical protein
MNTQARVHRLQAGQALPLPGRTVATAVLAEGELWVQEPARWLAGSVVLSPPVRLTAPAVLPRGASVSFVAIGPARVIAQEVVPLLSRERLRAVVTWAHETVAATFKGLRQALQR